MPTGDDPKWAWSGGIMTIPASARDGSLPTAPRLMITFTSTGDIIYDGMVYRLIGPVGSPEPEAASGGKLLDPEESPNRIIEVL